MLLSLSNPIAWSIVVKITHTFVDGDGSDELDVELLLSKDSRVMLTSNLWIEAGLVNGALGYVRSIVYRPRSAPPLPPSYVLMDFGSYSRIPFDDHILKEFQFLQLIEATQSRFL